MTTLFSLNKSWNKLPLAAVLLPAILSVPALAQTADPGQSSPPPAASNPAVQAPNPKPKEKKRGFEIPKIGIDYDIFLPSSGKTRDRFGKSWSGIGLGIGRPDRPSGTGRISLDFSTQYKKRGIDHAFMAPIGIGYRRAFSADALTQEITFVPYYGISADLVAVDLHSTADNVHSGFRLSVGGSALVGTTIGKSGFAEAKYLAIAKVKGFDLSGVSLAVGVRF